MNEYIVNERAAMGFLLALVFVFVYFVLSIGKLGGFVLISFFGGGGGRGESGCGVMNRSIDPHIHKCIKSAP